MPLNVSSKYILCVLVFLAGTPLPIFSQQVKPTWSYVNYGVNHGLPSSEVYDLHQDKRTGILWIATDRGLSTFDGYTFTTYTVDNGLTDNVILNLTTDKKDNLWLHTYSNQLCYVDTTHRIFKYPFNPALKKLNEQFYNDLFITVLNIDKNETLNLVPQHCMGQIRIDKNGNLTSDIKMLAYSKRKFINFFPERNYYYFSSLPKTRYAFPVSDVTRGAIHRLKDSTFVLTDNVHVKLFSGTQVKKEIEMTSGIHHSGCINDSLFWVATPKNGVDLFDENGNHVFNFLPGEMVTAVLADHEGGLWFSTLSNGIFYLKNIFIRTVPTNPDERLYSLSSLKNRLAIGNYSGSIYLLNATDFSLQACTELFSESPASIQCDTIRECLYVANNNFTARTGDKLQGVYKKSYPTKCVTENVYGQDVYYVGYSTIVQWRKDLFKIIRLPVRINDCANVNGTLWLATYNGLFIYRDSAMHEVKTAFNHARIDDIDMFRDGVLGASVGSGLIFHSADTSFCIKKTNGLLSNLCTEVFIQNDSTVWLATTAGANRIIFGDDFSYTISDYTITDGLISNEVVDFDTTENYLWIGTKRGLNFILKNSSPVQQDLHLFLRLTNVISNGTPVPVAHNAVHLSYNRNNVQVFFTAISFSRNSSLVYRYKLNSADRWNITTNRSVVFPALSMGNHTFEIQASVNRRQWSKSIFLTIYIRPPFWLTWWFIVSMSLCVIGIVYLIFYYRLRNQKLITRAIEMEMQALRAQMNPHFIFNSMASIQRFILLGNIDDSNKYLTRFSKLIRSVLENSKTELVSLKKELDSLSLYVELEQLRVKPFEYTLSVSPQIAQENILVPPLLLQPFIENAIWHGIEPSVKNNYLKLEITLLHHTLLCVIEDNGVGRDSKKIPQEIQTLKEKSFGIEITRERIRALKKTLQMDIQLFIVDKKDENGRATGTRVEIHIPVRNKI